MKFYKLDLNELQNELETDFEFGLNDSDVKSRARICGRNTLFSKPKLRPKSMCLPLLLISFIISIVYLLFALFNKNISFVYYAVVAILMAVICQVAIILVNYFLNKGIYISTLNKPYVLTVLRDGVKREVKYDDIVYGDIVFVEKGDYIPFDGIILSSNGLVTDESGVTGEDKVSKHPGVIYKDNAKPEELSNTVFCDSYVVHGKAKIVVTDVGERVYVLKSGKFKNKKNIRPSKMVDISTLFLTIFSVFCIIFTVIGGLISKDYVGIITSVLLFIIIVLSGYMKMSYKLICKKAFLDLNKKGIFLKSYSDIEKINDTNILLLNNEHIFDEKIDLSGFISEKLQYTNLSDITKSNFSVFLYAAFSLESKLEKQKSFVKILKKIGVDYDEFNSLCPILSSHSNDNLNMIARAYDGNNMIIASGEYSVIKTLCTNSLDENELQKLNDVSTEMFAVAVKNVDVVPDDLNDQKNGFSLVGIIGINRSIDKNTEKQFKLLRNCGVHPIVLFSGNLHSVLSTFPENKSYVSVNDIESMSKSDFEKIEYIYDYDGDLSSIKDKLSKVGLSFAYNGDKSSHKHSVSFKNIENKPFRTKDSDVLVSNGFKSIFDAFITVKKSNFMIKKAFNNYSLFCAFFVICGVLFSVLFKSTMVNTLAIGLILLIILPIAMLIALYTGISNTEISRDFKTNEILGNGILSYTIISSFLFILLCTCLKFLLVAEVACIFIIISFVTYVCFSADYIKEKPILCVISVIPAFILALIFISPLAVFFGYSTLGILYGIFAIVVGALLKFVSIFLSRSVKI